MICSIAWRLSKPIGAADQRMQTVALRTEVLNDSLPLVHVLAPFKEGRESEAANHSMDNGLNYFPGQRVIELQMQRLARLAPKRGF
jgi:hypothetical protein